MTRTAAVAGKRVIFDARPGESCVTGIGQYARTMKTLMKSVPGHFCFLLGEDLKWSPRTPIEEELELPGLLEREGCEVFHSPLFQLPAVLPCQAVVTIHDAIPLVGPELSNPGFTKLFQAQGREACERADAIVCPSEHAKRDLVSALGLRAEKVHVIAETPAPHFRVLPRSAASGRYFLFVGSLEKRKNPNVVLEALAKLPKADRRPVAFVGPEGGFDLLEEAKKLDVLEWVEKRGVVTDGELVRLYNDAIALVFPSLYEGFGLPLVEAFACGTPVIASNAASLPEIAGDAAILFQPGDADALARAMSSLTEERRSELRARGSRRLESFSQGRVCEQLARLYSELDT